MNEWIAIFETDQSYRAEIIKDLLSQNGIEAVILNQKDSSFTIGTIEIMVKEEDRPKATEILKSIACE